MAARQPQFSTKQIARALGASESSVKRWCDSGVIPTIKTVGGHRRITLDALQQFLRSTNRSLHEPHILGLPTLETSTKTQIPGNAALDSQNFRQALAAGDEASCRSILHRRIENNSLRSEAASDLITDAMHGLGEAWECNELDIYQERRAGDICIRLINELRADPPPPRPDAPVAIGGSPSGDPFQLPTALVELALREIGWNATSLGHNLPMDSFVQAARESQPRLVWLSVSVIEDPIKFIAEQNRLAGQLGEDVALIIGGRALTDQIRPQLLYTAHCDSLRSMTALAAMMLTK
jgi:excisionase family DNA binding protein